MTLKDVRDSGKQRRRNDIGKEKGMRKAEEEWRDDIGKETL